MLTFILVHIYWFLHVKGFKEKVKAVTSWTVMGSPC